MWGVRPFSRTLTRQREAPQTAFNTDAAHRAPPDDVDEEQANIVDELQQFWLAQRKRLFRHQQHIERALDIPLSPGHDFKKRSIGQLGYGTRLWQEAYDDLKTLIAVGPPRPDSPPE